VNKNKLTGLEKRKKHRREDRRIQLVKMNPPEQLQISVSLAYKKNHSI